MDELFFGWQLAALPLVGGLALLYRWVRQKTRLEQGHHKAQGFRLIHALNAYSAWIECLRCEPLSDKVQDQLAWPEPLRRARDLAQDSFPALSPLVMRLLQGDSQLMGYMWRQEVQRLSQPADLYPPIGDPEYQQIRGAQEDLIEEVIAGCRKIIGECPQKWRRTGSEFELSSGFGLSTTQDPLAGT